MCLCSVNIDSVLSQFFSVMFQSEFSPSSILFSHVFSVFLQYFIVLLVCSQCLFSRWLNFLTKTSAFGNFLRRIDLYLPSCFRFTSLFLPDMPSWKSSSSICPRNLAASTFWFFSLFCWVNWCYLTMFSYCNQDCCLIQTPFFQTPFELYCKMCREQKISFSYIFVRQMPNMFPV